MRGPAAGGPAAPGRLTKDADPAGGNRRRGGRMRDTRTTIFIKIRRIAACPSKLWSILANDLGFYEARPWSPKPIAKVAKPRTTTPLAPGRPEHDRCKPRSRQVQHEMSDIRSHHGSGWRVRQRDLHERVLTAIAATPNIPAMTASIALASRHGPAATQIERKATRNSCCSSSNGRKGRNPSVLESTGEEARQKQHQHEDRDRQNVREYCRVAGDDRAARTTRLPVMWAVKSPLRPRKPMMSVDPAVRLKNDRQGSAGQISCRGCHIRQTRAGGRDDAHSPAPAAGAAAGVRWKPRRRRRVVPSRSM